MTTKQATALAVFLFGPKAFGKARRNWRTIYMEAGNGRVGIHLLGHGPTWEAAFRHASFWEKKS